LERINLERYARDILVFTILLTGVYFRRMNYIERSLFSVGIMTVALSNLTVFLFALSNRSALVGTLFILAAFVIYLLRLLKETGKLSFTKKQKLGFYFSLFVFIPFVIYKIAAMIYFISMFVFVTPFIPWLLPEVNISIREFLGIIVGK